jgi:hypothetical protein
MATCWLTHSLPLIPWSCFVSPDKTRPGYKRKAVGEPTSSHDDEIKKKNVIKNPRNNAINGMRIRVRVRV